MAEIERDFLPGRPDVGDRRQEIVLIGIDVSRSPGGSCVAAPELVRRRGCAATAGRGRGSARWLRFSTPGNGCVCRDGGVGCGQVDQQALAAALDACLCSEEEEGRLRAGGAEEGEDPFQAWPDIVVRTRLHPFLSARFPPSRQRCFDCGVV